MVIFPWGAAVNIATMMKRNNERYEQKKIEEKESDNTVYVENIVVVYDDGSCCTIKNGLAIDVKDNSCSVNYSNCTDDDLIQILNALVNIAKEKGLLIKKDS